MRRGGEEHGNEDDEEESAFQRIRNSMLAGRKHTLQIVDVADILVAPVCVTHRNVNSESNNNGSRSDAQMMSDEDDDDDAETAGGEKITGFWMVMLKTRKCYNFAAHLHWLVSVVDKKVSCRPCTVLV